MKPIGSLTVIGVLLMMISPAALCGEYYVSPDGNAANPATRDAPWPLEKANAQAKAGDAIILLDGSYNRPIAPASNGEAGKPIAFKALNAGKAVFDGGPFERQEAIVLSGRSYVVIDAVTVKNARRFILAEGEATHYITITNCWFENASQRSFESCRFRGVGDGIHVSNCHLSCPVSGGNDLLAITGGQGHLIENNFFGDSAHTGLVLVMVHRSVVRGNKFTNRLGKMMEVFNTREVKEPHRLSEFNLIQDNLFDTCAGSGIQYAGSRMILRRNIFRRCNTAIEWTNYLGGAKTPEAWYGESNRFYNNVLYDCGPATRQAMDQRGIKGPVNGNKEGYGVAMEFTTNRVPPTHYGDDRCINNIIYGNVAGGGKIASTAQISFNWDASPDFGQFFYNDIMARAPDESVIYWLDAPHNKPPVKQNISLRELETLYPAQASHNLEADPQFVDPEKGDFHLKPTSPCIDAGGPLTTVAADSSGKIVKVADALYFTDGYGIDGVEGDLLRIAGQTARIANVNYQTNELTLDQAIRCEAGAAVHLNFLGKAPDIGAFECK